MHYAAFEERHRQQQQRSLRDTDGHKTRQCMHEKKLYGLFIFPWLQTNRKNKIGGAVSTPTCVAKLKTRFWNRNGMAWSNEE